VRGLRRGLVARRMLKNHFALWIGMAAASILILHARTSGQVSAIPADERLAGDASDSRTQQQWLAELALDREAVAGRPQDAQSYLALGRDLHALGETEAASQAVDQALRLQPNLTQALIEKGSILADQSKWTEAARAFRSAATTAPDSAPAHLWLGDMALRTGDFAGAADEFATVLHIAPGSSAAYQGLGLVDLQQGDFEKAADAFRRTLALRHGYLDAEEGLAHALAAAHQWPEAATLLRQVQAARPDSASEAADLGSVLQRMDDKADAAKQFARARELSDRELTVLRAKGDNNWGVMLRSEGKNVDAAAAFRRALDEAPDYCEAHDNLGSVLWLQNDPAGAMREFEDAVHCDPNLASARNNLGSALLYYGHDPDQAIAEFRAAVARRPGFALAHLNLAKSLAAERDFAGAEPEFRSAIAIDPSLAAAHVGLGLLLAAQKTAVSPEALAEMKLGLRLDPALRAIIPRQYLAELP
jgi:tetratricopeptide (TPR) repeat protein